MIGVESTTLNYLNSFGNNILTLKFLWKIKQNFSIIGVLNSIFICFHNYFSFMICNPFASSTIMSSGFLSGSRTS